MNLLKVSFPFQVLSLLWSSKPREYVKSMRTDYIWGKDKGHTSFEKHISFLDFNSPAAGIVIQSLLLLLTRTFPHISDPLSERRFT